MIKYDKKEEIFRKSAFNYIIHSAVARSITKYHKYLCFRKCYEDEVFRKFSAVLLINQIQEPENPFKVII